MPPVAHENAATESSNQRELTSLVAGCGIYRPDCVLFSFGGRDRIRWLNGMVSNNVRDLSAGHGVYAFVLNPQGNILGDLYIFNVGDRLIARIERTQAESLIQILRRYIIMDKVEIEDLTGKVETIGVAGPRSAELLASCDLDANLGPLEVCELGGSETGLMLVRGDNPCVPNFELLVPKERVVGIWSRLVRAGAEPVSDETIETFRILCGIPKFGQDIRERTLPQETGQDRALNFSKGCYIGQEIVERIRARGSVHRSFVGFEIEGPAPVPGTKIQSAGKDVGEITSVASALLKQQRIGLGYLRKEALTDEHLVAGDAALRVRTLPFTDIV